MAVASLARPPATVKLLAGDPSGAFLGPGWSESRRTDLDRDAGTLDPQYSGLAHFRFRAAAPGAAMRLPLRARGATVDLRLRAMARVRTAVALHASGAPPVETIVARGPWTDHALTLPAPGEGGFDASLTLRPMPLVRVPEEFVKDPELWVSEIEIAAPEGLDFTRLARAGLAALPLIAFAFALFVGAGPWAGSAVAVAAALAAVALARVAPLSLIMAATRLLPFALAAGALARLALGRTPAVTAGTRAALAGLVALGTLAHGALPFVPAFDPYDVEVHVRRAQDLGRVPLAYDALLRYGSHLPTETQTFGTATAALGERTLIPYSPLPYVAFYALHAMGLDLHWALIAFDAALAMLVAAAVWVVVAWAWSPGAGWVAALLYTLDLPVWHHLGRAHVPASFGAALGTAALLLLARRAWALDRPRAAAAVAVATAAAVLGYSSLIVFFGLFGAVLLGLVVLDAAAWSARAKTGTVLALVAGGLLAGVLFYFHYLPGLLRGAGGLQEEPDLFQARTYFVFHNESRQSMRVWAAGFAVPLVAGLLAAPFALRRARPEARPVFLAWLLTWPLVMLFKEPLFFPRPLRWAKEDQFISPLAAILIAAAAWALPRPWMRWSAAVLALAVAAWLQAGDFRTHATGIMP